MFPCSSLCCSGFTSVLGHKYTRGLLLVEAANALFTAQSRPVETSIPAEPRWTPVSRGEEEERGERKKRKEQMWRGEPQVPLFVFICVSGELSSSSSWRNSSTCNTQAAVNSLTQSVIYMFCVSAQQQPQQTGWRCHTSPHARAKPSMWCKHGLTDPLHLFCQAAGDLKRCPAVVTFRAAHKYLFHQRLPTGGVTAMGTNKKVCSTQKTPSSSCSERRPVIASCVSHRLLLHHCWLHYYYVIPKDGICLCSGWEAHRYCVIVSSAMFKEHSTVRDLSTFSECRVSTSWSRNFQSKSLLI